MADTPPNNGSAAPDGSSDDCEGERLTAEAQQYLRTATDQSARAVENQDHVIDLLSADIPSEPVAQELNRRAAASGTLAVIAHETPVRLTDRLPVLGNELRVELDRTIPDENSELRDRSRAIRDNLVSSTAHVIANDSTTITSSDGIAVFINGVATDLTDGTLRAAANALFACASDHRESVVRATGLLEKLLAYPDSAVQAWSAATLGELTDEAPDAVAATAGDLRDLLDHDNETVQHNAVEALAALVRERPDAVVPAADTMQELLTYDDVALQHNAVGVLGCLMTSHPDVVVPAVNDLKELCTHEDEAVRRIATGTLTRLAQERPEVVSDT